MRRSNRMPSARPVSKARFTHSLARYTAGRENEAICWCVAPEPGKMPMGDLGLPKPGRFGG